MLLVTLVCSLLAGPAAAKADVKRWISELQGPDAGRQAVAARVLGRAGDKAAVEPLLARLDARNAPVKVTAAVVEALGRLGDPRAVDGLLGAWDYLNSVKLETGGDLPPALQALRATVMEALGAAGGDRVQPVLAAGLTDPDAQVAQKAALGLGRTGDGRHVEALATLLPKGGPTAQAAFEALAAIGDSRAQSAARPYLASEDALTHVQAAHVLARHDAAAKAALVKAAGEVRGLSAARLLAAHYLALMGEKAGFQALALALQKGTPSEKARAADALARNGREPALRTLLEAAEAAEAPTRQIAAKALARLGGSKPTAALRRLAVDKDPGVRAAAHQGLAEQGELP